MNTIHTLNQGQLLKLERTFELPKTLEESIMLRGVRAELESRKTELRTGETREDELEEEIQEQKDEINSLEGKLEEKEAECGELEARIKELEGRPSDSLEQKVAVALG